MAKRRYRRYYKKKGRWSANIRSIVNTTVAASSYEFFGALTLATNPPQTETTVSQQYTVKNVEFSFQIEYGGGDQDRRNGIESLAAFIVYVPQGMTVGYNYVNLHPEYIMAYKFLGSPDIEQTSTSNTATQVFRNPLTIKTRMARRLQTGDQIIWFIRGFNTSSSTADLNVNGIIRWWTKAN